MFGAGGGTSSYREIEETDVVLLWGSNARETHPIFFHHLLRGVRNGARLFAVDPRRTTPATAPDTRLASSVWRRCSERAAARRRTARSRRRTSILLWGSNARETHPIFFHHLLKGVHNGARLFVVDPRRTSLGAVGRPLARARRRLRHRALERHGARDHPRGARTTAPFVERATEGFDAYAASVEPFTLAEGERLTGVPADVIRETAHAYARADRAMICWTLGITEHHNAVDNVLALINLGLLCGHVGRYGSGLNPLRGQNNVQGGGDMGAIPNKLPGFQDIEHDADARARFEAGVGHADPPGSTAGT